MYTKEENVEKIIKNTKQFFKLELILSIFLSLFSTLSKSKLVLIISLPTTIYNVYIYFNKSYILEYEIASPRNNQKTYYQESLKHKIKFTIYIIISIISGIMLIIRFVFFILEFILQSKERTDKFFEIILKIKEIFRGK